MAERIPQQVDWTVDDEPKRSCETCRFYEPDLSLAKLGHGVDLQQKYAYCRKPLPEDRLLHGSPMYAAIARASSISYLCGPRLQHYEACYARNFEQNPPIGMWQEAGAL